jgi:hypothetical protein
MRTMAARTWRHEIRDALIVAIAVTCLLPLSTWMAYQSNMAVSAAGWLALNLTSFVAVFGGCGLIVCLLALPIVALTLKDRRWVLQSAIWSVALIASFVVGAFIHRPIFRNSIERIGRNSEPLIAAIERYEAAHGRPPAELKDLVPNEIERIPRTGIGVFPDFQYFSNQPYRYDGNSWVLIVEPPSFIMGFDQVLYFPKQNYPEHGYGGMLERIGKWAYVHE